MRRLTAEGVAPAEAARWARQAPPDARRTGSPRRRRPVRPQLVRDGGGSPSRSARAGPAARGLARAAMRLDSTAMREIIETRRRRPTASSPPGTGCSARCSPASASGTPPPSALIEVEHLLSRCVSEVLGAVPAAAGAPTARRGSCSPAPTRSSTACRWRRWPPRSPRPACRCRLLGARVPARRPGRRGRTAPGRRSWCSGRTRPPPADPAQLRALLARARAGRAAARRRPRLARRRPARRGGRCPTSLTEAVDVARRRLSERGDLPLASRPVRPAPGAPGRAPMTRRITRCCRPHWRARPCSSESA